VSTRFEVVGLGADAVDYLEAWELQRRVHAEVVAGERPDTVLLLEHPPVYTAGKRTEPHERPVDSGGAPVLDVDRGGKITFHGPGQLVAYPIVRLPEHVLVVDFVRRLEEAMIATCADFGVAAARVPGRSGVWLRADAGPRAERAWSGTARSRSAATSSQSGGATGGGAPPRVERKVGAIGLRVSQGVTMHGIALNCDVDLGWYDRFVPCGIADAGVTTLSLEVGRPVGVPEVLPVLRARLAELLSWQPYSATPDYEARPDPAKRPRIELVTP
jgi:lipoyl(octanoyl) transferase